MPFNKKVLKQVCQQYHFGTGNSIKAKVIDMAKGKITVDSKSVSQIAYELGFKYPQHFTWLFKQKVGKSPNEYRTAMN